MTRRINPKKTRKRKIKKTKKQGGAIKRSNNYPGSSDEEVFDTFISSINIIDVIIGTTYLIFTVSGNESVYLENEIASGRLLLKLFWISKISTSNQLPDGTSFLSITKEEFKRQVLLQNEFVPLTPQTIYSSSNYKNVNVLKEKINKKENNEKENKLIEEIIKKISDINKVHFLTQNSWGIIAMEYPINYNIYGLESLKIYEKIQLLLETFKVLIQAAVIYGKIINGLHASNIIVNKKTRKIMIIGLNNVHNVDTREELKIIKLEKERIEKNKKKFTSEELQGMLRSKMTRGELIQYYYNKTKFVDILLLIMKNDWSLMTEYLHLSKVIPETEFSWEKVVEAVKPKFIEERINKEITLLIKQKDRSEQIKQIMDITNTLKHTEFLEYASLLTEDDFLFLIFMTNIPGYTFWKKWNELSQPGNIVSIVNFKMFEPKFVDNIAILSDIDMNIDFVEIREKVELFKKTELERQFTLENMSDAMKEFLKRLYTNTLDPDFLKFVFIVENSELDIREKSMLIAFSTLTLNDRVILYMYFAVIDKEKYVEDNNPSISYYNKVLKTFKKRWDNIKDLLSYKEPNSDSLSEPQSEPQLISV